MIYFDRIAFGIVEIWRGPVLPVGTNKGDMMQPGVPLGRRKTAEALYRVEPHMVMVPAGPKESASFPDPLLRFQPKHLGIEIDRPIKVGDPQVSMANPSPQVGVPSDVTVHLVTPDEPSVVYLAYIRRADEGTHLIPPASALCHVMPKGSGEKASCRSARRAVDGTVVIRNTTTRSGQRYVAGAAIIVVVDGRINAGRQRSACVFQARRN